VSQLSGQAKFNDPFLNERYGIKKNRFASWVLPALFFGLVGGSWLIWSANHYSKPETRSTLISFHAVNSTTMQIRYLLLLRSSNQSHSCRLVARDYSANVVGEVTDLIPSGVSAITRTINIPTRVLAVNAGILGCLP
jgi:hypothetical protein